MEVLSFGLKRCPHCQKFVWGFSLPWSDLTFEFSAGENGHPSRLWPPYKSPWTCLSWLKLHEPPFEHCPCAFHSTHSPTFHVCLLSFVTLGDWSSFHNFASDSEVSSAHHLINMKFYRCLPSWITCLSIYSNGFLIVQQRQDGLKLNRSLVILTCAILSGSFLKAYHMLIIELDPIERRNFKRRHSANANWTNLRVLVPLHKLRLHGHAVFLSRICGTHEQVALRDLLFFRKWTCLSGSLFNADAIIASNMSQSVKSLRPVLDCEVMR